MRAPALALALAIVLPTPSLADEALPPPRVVPHGGAREAPAPKPPPSPAASPRPKAAPPRSPTPQPAPGDLQRRHLKGTSIAIPVEPGPAPRAAPVPAVRQAPSQREIQSQVDRYLRTDAPAIAAAGRAGAAGYDQGFFLRGGDTTLRMNFVLQSRYEAFLWNNIAPAPGGDRSGFSVPRALLRFSGNTSCRVQYFLELDFGHNGAALATSQVLGCAVCTPNNLGPDAQANNWSRLREAWIEWNQSRLLNVRMGLVQIPTTRQLLVRPEMTQFVDISLASAWMGLGMPGYTDRNRDMGVLVHGAFGSERPLQYMFALTNGDGGDGIRNIIDRRSSDNLAYSGRLNWVFARPQGYEEGALRQCVGQLYGEVGAWAFYYSDRRDRPHVKLGDYLRYGVDAALGINGWTFTGALSFTDDSRVMGTNNDTSTAWLVQLGHHFRGTPWEIAARWSGYDTKGDLTGDGIAQEAALGINYYLNGHGNKMQLDAAYIDTTVGGFLILDAFAGYPAFLALRDTAWLLRFQWQLAL